MYGNECSEQHSRFLSIVAIKQTFIGKSLIQQYAIGYGKELVLKVILVIQVPRFCHPCVVRKTLVPDKGLSYTIMKTMENELQR